MMEALQPDARDIELCRTAALPNCPLCGGTPFTMNKVNRETGVYRGIVACSKCGCQVGSNFLSREDALDDAIRVWRMRTQTVPALTDSSIPIADAELLRRAVQMARTKRTRGYHARWVAVMDLFMLGSTYAHVLCRRFGFDPAERVR